MPQLDEKTGLWGWSVPTIFLTSAGLHSHLGYTPFLTTN